MNANNTSVASMKIHNVFLYIIFLSFNIFPLSILHSPAPPTFWNCYDFYVSFFIDFFLLTIYNICFPLIYTEEKSQKDQVVTDSKASKPLLTY